MSTADDLEDLRQLKARYFRFIDLKDWDALRTVVADDLVAQVDNGVSVRGGDPRTGPVWRSGDEFVTAVASMIDEASTVHQGHMPELTVTSETSASGIWAMADILSFPDGRLLHGAGHYHETYAKRGGRWLITTMHLTRTRIELTGDWSAR